MEKQTYENQPKMSQELGLAMEWGIHSGFLHMGCASNRAEKQTNQLFGGIHAIYAIHVAGRSVPRTLISCLLSSNQERPYAKIMKERGSLGNTHTHIYAGLSTSAIHISGKHLQNPISSFPLLSGVISRHRNELKAEGNPTATYYTTLASKN